MKRIEFVLCLFFISTVSFAQKEIAPTKNLDAYIGTWMYQSNDTIFKIVLKKRICRGSTHDYKWSYGRIFSISEGNNCRKLF